MELTSNALRELLNDLNHFLSQTLNGETLSEHAISEKEALLVRLASQLSPAYLDMNGISKGAEQVEEYVDVEPAAVDQTGEVECYEEFPDKQRRSNSPQSEDDKSATAVDYENISLPFSKLREEANKSGCLCKKEKFLFIERLMRYWAGIKHDLLLTYSSERDTKPCSIITLRSYYARSAPYYYPKDPKKQECCFEIVSPGKKTHQFIARTVKDKEQWITAINDVSHKQMSEEEEREIAKVRARSLPPSPVGTDNEEEYDDIRAHNHEYDNEEIYHDISELVPEVHSERIDPQSLRNRPVPSIPQEDSSDHESTYDDVDNLHLDNVYYNCSDKSEANEKKSQVDTEAEYMEEEDIYDDIGVIDRLGVQKGPLNQDITNPSGRIHHLIQKMEASLGSGLKTCSSVSSNKQTSDSNIPSEEFYEPIDILDEGTNRTDSKPIIAPRTNHVRF